MNMHLGWCEHLQKWVNGDEMNASLYLALVDRGLLNMLNGPTVHAIKYAYKSPFLVHCYGLAQIEAIYILQGYFTYIG